MRHSNRWTGSGTASVAGNRVRIAALALCVSSGFGAILGLEAISLADGTAGNQERPATISMIELLATPDAFAGRWVEFVGYAQVDSDHVAVFVTREMASPGSPRTCVSLTLPHKSGLNNEFVIVNGKFSPSSPQQSFDCAGSLSDVGGMAKFPPK